MTYGVQKSAAAAFLILVLLIIANAFVSYQNLRRLLNNQQTLNRTGETQLAIKQTFSMLKDLELGERGYIITGNEDFLEPYRIAVNQLDEQIAVLAASMSEDTRDDEALAELETLIDEKLALVDEAIETHNQQGPDAAMAVVSAGHGKEFMDQIRELVNGLERREQVERDRRWRQSQQSYETAQISFALANTSALALVALVFMLVRRETMESRRTTALLRRSESRFRRLVDANVMGVFFAEFDGKVIEANDAFLQMIGHTREDLTAGTIDWRQLTPAEFAPLDAHAIAEVKARGASEAFEKQFRRKDGSVVPVMVGCALLDDPQGVSICYAVDLTDRERARNEIQALNALCLQRIQELETLLEVIPIGIAISQDADGDNITVNSAMAQMMGLPPGVVGSSMSHHKRSLLTELLEHAGEDSASLPEQAVEGANAPGRELEVVRRDGPALQLLQYVAPLVDSQGRRRGSVGAFVDITDRKRLEEQLRQNADDLHNQQRWLEAVLDLLPMPMLLIDPVRGLPTFANKAAKEMADGRFPLVSTSVDGLGSAEHCTGLNGQCIPPEQMPGARVARGERLSGYELDWHLPAGTRSLLINAGSLPGMYGHEGVSVMLFQDITELKQIEGELRRINQAKDALLAMLGHELRNPLAAITGAAELIRNRDAGDIGLDQAQEILDRHLRHLARLVDDMLDLSRLASGKMVLQPVRTELSTILKQAVQTVQLFVDARGHQLHVQMPREPVWVDADTPRLEQVFVNLLMNAAKYTDPGGTIALNAEITADRVRIRVRDNGVGIAPEMLANVFDLFAQLNPSIDRSEGGLGIGLNVVKNLVEMHGGSVEAFSQGLGQGSEFIVELPRVSGPSRPTSDASEQSAQHKEAPVVSRAAKPENAGIRDASKPATGPKARVMVVDDNADIARVTAALVRRLGHETRVANDGGSGLELAKEFQPQIALLDIGLPGMSGHELARRLRHEAGLEEMFLVALTGYGQEEDRRRSAEAGFDQHLTKPVSFDQLADVLQHALESFASQGVSVARPAEGSHVDW